ncbi:MAG: hypothetical protein WCG20_01840 [bacterium]
MEFKFPTNDAGMFVSQEELTKQQDELKIQEISKLTKAVPHVIKKEADGEWTVSGFTIEDYLRLHEGNDNSDMWKRNK